MEPLRDFDNISTVALSQHRSQVLDSIENEGGPGIADLLEILHRRKVALVFTMAVLFSASVIFAWSLPKLYRSTATILIEQQEIPESFVSSTVSTYAEERIATITQRVMTTSNLEGIVNKLGLYPDIRKKTPMDILANRVRNNFSVEHVRARGNTVSFNISYDSRSPVVAQLVATELSSLYLEENLKIRTESAADTTGFLNTEAERLGEEISALEMKIAAFKEAHMGRLPSQLSLNLQLMSRTEQNIRNIDQQIRTLEDRKVFLAIAMEQLKANPSGGPNQIEVQLKSLQAQLRGMLAIYKDDHPDVTRLRTEIAALEGAISSSEVSSASGATNFGYLDRKAQYEATGSEIKRLQAERIEQQKRLALYEDRIEQTPRIEREYSLLIRDQNNLSAKYKEIRAKQSTARVAENLERANKGERFLLIEPARRPRTPFKPNRKKILLLGAIGSIGAGFGVAVFIELLQKAVYGVRGVTAALGAPPLAVIPYIENSRSRLRRSLMWSLIAVLIIIFLGVGAAFVHFRIIPLEELWTAIFVHMEGIWDTVTQKIFAILAMSRAA